MKRPQGYSLRNRLLILLIGLVAVLWLGSSVLAFRHALIESDELFDAQMVQASELLLGLLRAADVDSQAGRLLSRAGARGGPVFFQVLDWHRGGWRLLAGSKAAADDGLPWAALNEGFSRIHFRGESWRLFVRPDVAGDGRPLRIVVGQRYGIRDDLAHEFAEHLAIPLGLAFPLMAVAIWWAVSRAMRPVREAADTVSAMPVDRLQPIALSDPAPDEIEPLLRAIDTLTARVSGAIEKERRFTADAAHELRTPLAALRVHAQVAMRVSAPDERHHALTQVMAGVERMTHLVEQLLDLARLDPAVLGAAEEAETDLCDAAAVACAELAPRAIERHQEVRLNATAPANARVGQTWAQALVRNLVDNALRYGRDGGRVEVDVAAAGDGVELRVRDDGPGVVPKQRGRLVERFYRAPDARADGCGLGLSIVSRIVESAAARIEFTDGLPRGDGGVGLGVRVRFPAA